MLVLSRKVGEAIYIDDKVIVTVVEIRGDKIRLGVEAPREVPVHRKEVADAIARNKKLKEESNPEVSDPPPGS